MAATLLGITQSAASAATIVETKASLRTSPGTVKYQGSATVSGTVMGWHPTSKEWQKAPVGTVRLQTKKTTGGAWQTVASRQLSASRQGDYSFTRVGDSNRHYRILYSGGTYNDFRFKAFTSAHRSVWVRRDLNDALIRSGKRFYIWGNIDPGWANSYVYVQRKTCSSCAWKAYKSARADHRGVFKIGIGVPKRGSWWFRAVLPKSAGYVASQSDYVYRTYRTFGREGARLVG